jgi:transcriptional antiterminator Rof (Rho-off)
VPVDQSFKSVNCAFYDDLELLSMRHSFCDIIFEADNGGRSAIRDRIANLHTREGIEYMTTASGLEIDLTKILEVNGKKPLNAC